MLNAITSSSTTANQSQQATASNAQLDKNQFLNLLMTQLEHQDPMNPVDEKDFMAQMAQFSTLEQVTNLAEAMTAANLTSQVSQATSLLGHDVSWENADGTTGSGTPTKVTVDGSTVELQVGSTTITPDQIRTIGPIPAAQPAAGSATDATGSQP